LEDYLVSQPRGSAQKLIAALLEEDVRKIRGKIRHPAPLWSEAALFSSLTPFFCLSLLQNFLEYLG
jgi:hypothetical protein